MDISQEIAFRQLLEDMIQSKSKGVDYFEKNFQHTKEVIKQYRPEVHKYLETLKTMLEEKAKEQVTREC